jgi:hypothetical protein
VAGLAKDDGVRTTALEDEPPGLMVFFSWQVTPGSTVHESMHSGARCSAGTIYDGCKCHPDNCNLQRLLVAKALPPMYWKCVPVTNLLCDIAIVSPRTGYISQERDQAVTHLTRMA